MLQKTLKISRVKYNGSYVPKIRLSAFWVNDIGFECGKKLKLDYSREHITLQLFDDINAFESQTCFKLNVISIRGKNASIPCIDIRGLWLSEIGFKIGDEVLINTGFGIIDIVPLKG